MGKFGAPRVFDFREVLHQVTDGRSSRGALGRGDILFLLGSWGEEVVKVSHPQGVCICIIVADGLWARPRRAAGVASTLRAQTLDAAVAGSVRIGGSEGHGATGQTAVYEIFSSRGAGLS